MALSGRKANVRITSLTATSSTGEACTRSTGTGANGYVQVTSTAHRHIDPDTTPTLYLNSTAVSSTAYTFNYVQGKFEWGSGDPSTGTYTAHVDWLTVSTVAQAREWQLTSQQDMLETTVFGSSGWKQFIPDMAGATATINRFWDTDNSFFDRLTTNSKFLVELMISSTGGERYEGFCYASQDQIADSVEAVVTEGVNLTIDGKLYYST